MLRTTKNMREKYEKIQSLIFSLIPEKWEAIYLYASVISGTGNSQTGELFFYYIPKGILRKKPINVYEVPQRFNINEEQYLKMVGELYKNIKELKQEFIDMDQDLWTNLTISINNMRFKIEYNYEQLPMDEIESNERRVIWRYKYLKIGGEKKEEKKILDEYFSKKIITKKKRKDEVYETGLYMKTDSSSVGFDKEDVSSNPKEVIVYEKEEQEEKSENEEINNNENIKKDEDKKQKENKNQILKF